jgi:hypothetical protein
MIIAALDISSFRLDCCILADDQPPVLRNAIIRKDGESLIDGLRRVPTAIDSFGLDCLAWNPTGSYWDSADWVVIEDPGSLRYPDLIRALFTTLGAITASVPSECQIGWRRASEWRHDLGAKNTKAAGHREIIDRLHETFGAGQWGQLDEHELDAIGLALAWQKLLAANAREATPGEASTTRAASAGGNT